MTITYLASQNWVLDSERELAAQFEAETGIHVDYQIIPADQYFSVLQTKLEAGGEGIDIFGGQSGKSDIQLQLGVEENAVALTDEEWVQRMDPLSTEQISLDGTVYGLTIWDTVGGSWVVVYNKTIFADNGIEVPTTYDEFAAACQTLSSAGVAPIYEPVSDGWHHVLWSAELGPAYEAASPGLVERLNANEVAMADDATMQLALGQLNDLYSNGCFGDNTLSDEFANTEANMASGDYAMTVNRLGLPAQIEAADPSASAGDYGFFLMPLADNQIWNVNPAAPSKFIYTGSEHIDAAKAYFEFLASPENLQFVLDNEAQFVLLNFEGVYAELSEAQQEFVDAYPDQGTVLQTAVDYVNPQWIEMGQDIVAMFTGAQTPVEVLDAIDGRRGEMATAADDPGWEDRRSGGVSQIAEGLPLQVLGIGGAIDVAFIGNTAYVLVTLVGGDIVGGPPIGDAVVGIYRLDKDGGFTPIADIGAWSIAHPPTTDYFITTGVQYALEVFRGGFLVTDGHHNRVLHVTFDGQITEVVTYGNVVPTGLEASGNRVHIGQTGPVPHLPADGKVVSVSPKSWSSAGIASGASMIVDVEFGGGHTLYALSQGMWDGVAEGSPAQPNTGRLVRVGSDGSLTPVVDASGVELVLDRPTSMEFIGRTAYIVSLTGTVVKIDNI